MHSKETVWYIRRRYVRGETRYDYFYKRELLTSDSYRNLNSVYWSSDKPINRRTFEKAQREGYKCDTYCVYLPPIELVNLSERRELRGRIREDTTGRETSGRYGKVVRLLRVRLHESMGL